MAQTGFTALANGFHFANRFVNTVLKTPFGSITTSGRCGGMAFAALDCWYGHRPIPAETSAQWPVGYPPDGNPIADYIFARLIDSFVCSTANQFLSWTVASDHQTMISPGVTNWTRNDSWPFLRHQIDLGKPVALGLIQAGSLANVAENHQVVAAGYDLDQNGLMTVRIYDNRYPGVEHTLQSAPGNPHWNQSDGTIWRGWFVQSYAPKSPPATFV